MLRSKHNEQNISGQIDWKKHLEPAEFAAAEKIKQILNSSEKISFERASLEAYTVADSKKDPYELFISTSSLGSIHTDGQITKGRIFPLANGEMQSMSISNYNYIIFKQHLPSPKKGEPGTWKQAVVTKTRALSLYVKYLLGRPL